MVNAQSRANSVVSSVSHYRLAHVQHTPGHLHCAACLEARKLFTRTISASMSFTEASAAFLESRTAPANPGRSRFVSKRTFRDYEYYLKTLGTFFGELPLEEIHTGHLVEYQRRRSIGEGFVRRIGNRKDAPWIPSPAGSQKINREIEVLKRLMKMAGLWPEEGELDTCYVPYQVQEPERQRCLSPDEQERFLVVAGSNPAWAPVWWYSLVAVHLCFSSDEMRTIRIGDINLTYQIIGVNRLYGKNKFRRREVPICESGCGWALERLIARAKEFGGGGPQHFLFPFRQKDRTHDPDRPMSETGLRKQFEAVRKAAGVEWFPFNGWRHTAITRLAEAGVPIAMIMQRSGHVTTEMSDHYTHISEQAHRFTITAATQRGSVISIEAARTRAQMVG
jgi:integrase